MAWFFTEKEIQSDKFTITGEDARHISRSLRMHKGENLTLCSADGRRYLCVITSIKNDEIEVDILDSTACEQEADVNISLFIALLKGSKIEDVIQKCVELGIYDITPVLTKRCISRPDDKGMKNKIERWQKISDNAAMQSRRGIMPKIHPLINLEDFDPKNYDISMVFYECRGQSIRSLINHNEKKIAVITGSEGGFEETEILMLNKKGVKTATLGKRILRAQTAPLAALTALMYETGNLE